MRQSSSSIPFYAPRTPLLNRSNFNLSVSSAAHSTCARVQRSESRQGSVTASKRGDMKPAPQRPHRGSCSTREYRGATEKNPSVGSAPGAAHPSPQFCPERKGHFCNMLNATDGVYGTDLSPFTLLSVRIPDHGVGLTEQGLAPSSPQRHRICRSGIPSATGITNEAVAEPPSTAFQQSSAQSADFTKNRQPSPSRVSTPTAV